MSTTASLRSKLLLAIFSILVLLCGLEGFARVVLGAAPSVEDLQLSSELGWEWAPGYDAIETYHGVSYHVLISSQGLRNEEITLPKPPETYRIIALGDSITVGVGVELEQTFAKLLERSLQANTSPGQTVEVINAGTNDYGTSQEVIWLRRRGLKYEPNLVIVIVYLNDSRPFDPPPAWVAYLDNFFVPRSAFYYFYRTFILTRRANQAAASPDFRFRFGDELQSRAWVDDPAALTAVIKAANQDWGLAWNDQERAKIEAGLTEIIEMAGEHQFDLLLVLFPTNVQVQTQVDTPLGLDRPQQNLVAFAHQHDVPVLDLLPLLRAHQTEDLFFDQVHLKPMGHQLVANTMAQALHQHSFVPLP